MTTPSEAPEPAVEQLDARPDPERKRRPMTTDTPPPARRRPDAQPDAGAHLYPVGDAQPRLTPEYRLRFFSTSTVGGVHVTPAITLDEAESIASRLQRVAWVIERRMTGPWQPTSAPQRNRQVRDTVDPDDPHDLHPDADASPPYRPRKGRPFHGQPRDTRDEVNAEPDPGAARDDAGDSPA